MHALALKRLSRKLTLSISVLLLASCGQGDGPVSIAGTPATPLPPIPSGFCDAINFEDLCAPATIVNFNGGATTIIVNPDPTGINESEKVAQMQKFPDEVFGGTKFDLGSAIDFGAGEAYTIKVWSPRSVEVLFKLEETGNPGGGFATTVNHSGGGAWEELCFDFAGQNVPGSVTALTIIFDNGTQGAADTDPSNWTFYYDDIEQVASCGAGGDGGTGFELVFADEFDEGTAPDPSKWNYETGYGSNGWGNNEWQLYTESPDNVRVEDGNLVISALCPTAPCGIRDGSITSGRINTLGKFNFKFGKIVARIKPPTGKAAWPAFWSLGTNFADVGWPRSGEIDFMEVHNFYSDENTTHFTMHWWDQDADSWVYDSQFLTTGENLGDDFHIFEADWNEDRIIGKIDGQTYFTRAIEPGTMEEFLEEFFLILNVAMGGTLGSGNEPPAGDETFPQTMLVDYVRVFEGSEGSGGGAGGVLANFDDVIPSTITEFDGAGYAIEAGPEGGDGNAMRITRDGGEVYAGVFISASVIPSDAGEQTISALVYSPTAGIPFVTKLEFAQGEGSGDVQANETVVEGWQTLTWTYSLEAGNDYSRFVILPNLGTVGAGESYYIDNITLVGGDGGGGGGTGGGDAPTVAAQTPPVRDAADVVSLFSDAYTDVTVDTWKTDWSITSLADVDIAGNATKEYTNLNFVGIETVAEQVDATGMTHFHVDIWTPNAESLEIKLVDFGANGAYDGPGAGDDTEGSFFLNAESTPPLQGEWVSLDIPMADFEAAGLTTRANIAQLIFAATPSDNVTLYVDNVYFYNDAGGGGGGGGGSAPVLSDFEGAGPFNFTDFDGGATTVLPNPDASGINTSATVVQMQKFAGQPWGGTTLDMGGVVDWSAGEVYTVKVRSSRVVDVLLKLEPLNLEQTATHGGTGWEELCFDFTGTTGEATALTLIFDNGVMGDAAGDPANWTFEFDDIQQAASCPGGGGGGGAFAPITFDDAGIIYTLTDFGGNASVVTNDPAGGANMVAQAIKSDTAELWAGTTVSTEANEAIPTIPLDAANTQMTVRVYSPDAGIQVRLKVEDASNNTITVETEATTTMVNAWETLTFDFANPAAGTAAFNEANTYNKVSIFFNFGVTGATAGEKTYYFDDIDVVAGGGGGGPTSARALTDFEDAGAPYTFSDFDGGAATVVDNPDVSGIDVSAKVAQMQKFAGQPWGGTTLDMGGDVDWSGGEVWTMKVRSSRAVPVLFKWEGLNEELSVDHAGSGTWEELCFDFTGTTGGAAATALTLIFDLGVMGDAAGDPANWTFEFDDITQVASCPGGGGGSGADIDFEAGGAGAGFTWATFENDDNPALEIIANPVSGGINTSATVAKFTARLGGQPWAGVETAHGDIGPLTLDATNSTIKIMVYKSVISDVGIKFAIANGGAQPEIKVANTLIDQWEELTFDFSGNIGLVESIDIDQIIVFGDFDLAGRAQENIVYFDNIAFTDGSGGGGGGGGGGSAPVLSDFEGAGPFNFTDFDGGATTVLPNPDASGINTSATVVQMQKFAGQPWGGTTLDMGGVVDWSAGEVYTVKVRSSRVVDVLLKLEPLNLEQTATHGGTGWEELCFDFTGTTGEATALTLIFDNGVMGDAAGDPANWTFEFDDIQQAASCPGGGGGGGAFAPITFDDAGIIYTLTDFGGNASVVTNDPAGGANMVAQAIKSDTAELWAGTTVSTEANEAIPTIPLDAANTEMSVRVYSPDAGIQVRLKVEDASNNTITVETEATTTMVNAWETLTFDFANPAAGTAAFNEANTYNKVSIFFNFGVTGATAGEKTYYFDDIDVVAGGGGGATAVTDFEGAPESYVFSDFDGGAATVIANPVAGGINTSAQVGQMLKFAGQPWGGSTLTLDAAVDIAAGTVITLKVWSQRAVPVLFKLEGMNVERSANHGGSGWEELSFDFTGDSGTGVAAITLIFDLGVMGDAAGDPANWTFYFDDMVLPEAGGGGGGGGGSSGSAAIDFEAGGAGAGFTWSTFENVDNPALEIVANPVSGGINTSATVAKFTARLGGQPWAGVETAHGDIGPMTLDATNSTIKIMVYKSVMSDVGIKFAIANGGAQPEIKVANTLIDQWEELTFDYSGNIGLVESIDIDQIIVFGDFDLAGRAQDNVVYFDNISFNAQ